MKINNSVPLSLVEKNKNNQKKQIVPFSGGMLMDPNARNILSSKIDAVPPHLKSNNMVPNSFWLQLSQNKIHQMLIDSKLQKPEYEGSVLKNFLQKQKLI